MAEVKLMKIGSDGDLAEFASATDQITLASFSITGSGPALSATGLAMADQDVSGIKDISFNDSSTATIGVNGGTKIIDNLMFETKENTLTTAGAVLFPVVTDAAGELDAFRLPAIAGAPSATPADGGEGYVVWDSTNDKMYAWNGTAWDDLSSVSDANRVCNTYTADEALTLGDAVYISAADNVSKCDVSAAGAATQCIGFAKAGAADTESVEVCSEGILTGLSGLTPGAKYYLDPASAGDITTTLPVGTGNVAVLAGYAKSATVLHLQITRIGKRA